MAFPKKGLRKIVVAGNKYAYNVTGNDGWISFSVALFEKNREILTGSFSYNSNNITNFDKNGKPQSWSLYQRIKVTPTTIRQVIEYALEKGWNPFENKGEFRLGNMDKEINLNLKEKTIFPKLIENQVALILAEVATGKVLKVNQELYEGEGEIYQVFESLKQAKEYAKKLINKDSDLECWIVKEKDKAMFYMSSIEEREFSK